MKGVLSKDVIALTGDFGPSRTHEALKRWIQKNGGRYTTDISAANTHLICTEDHWKRCTTAVKLALRHKNIKIVTFDWLEDSLQNNTHKREGPYLLHRLEKERKKVKVERREKERKAAKEDVSEFEKGAKAAEAALGSGGSSADESASPSQGRSKKTSWAVEALSQVRKQRKEKEEAAKTSKGTPVGESDDADGPGE